MDQKFKKQIWWINENRNQKPSDLLNIETSSRRTRKCRNKNLDLTINIDPKPGANTYLIEMENIALQSLFGIRCLLPIPMQVLKDGEGKG